MVLVLRNFKTNSALRPSKTPDTLEEITVISGNSKGTVAIDNGVLS